MSEMSADPALPDSPDVSSTAAETLAVGRRLRAARRNRSLSLKDVERLSARRFKIGVLGAYERGDRNINITQLLELAEFYGVPAGELLHEGAGGRRSSAPRLTINMPVLAAHPGYAPVYRYLQTVVAARGGSVDGTVSRFESFRTDDLAVMAATVGLAPEALRTAFVDAEILTG